MKSYKIFIKKTYSHGSVDYYAIPVDEFGTTQGQWCIEITLNSICEIPQISKTAISNAVRVGENIVSEKINKKEFVSALNKALIEIKNWSKSKI